MNTSGNYAETVFISECVKHGLSVSLPMHTCRYDIITDNNGVLKRVQIKSTDLLQQDRRYHVKLVGSCNTKYENTDLDIYAIYIIPENDWYIFPTEFELSTFVLSDKTMHKYMKNKNRFDLL